jgi:hypothetical protein
MIFNRKTLFSLVLAATLAPIAFGQIAVDTTKSAQELVDRLVGSGVITSNAVITAGLNTDALGFFDDATGPPIFGFASGIALSSGAVQNVIGPNLSPSSTVNNNGPGDAQLNADVFFGAPVTFDATSLEFDFMCLENNGFSFEYVFGSEEYNEYVDTQFNDAFAFYLNGVNIALLPNNQAVSINNVNCGNPSQGTFNPNVDNGKFCTTLFNDNTGLLQTNTEFDGYTDNLFTNQILPGNALNHLKIVIADAGDGALDSAVLLRADSLVCAPPGPGTCSSPAGCNGDPHFKTWRGHHFDFHGECDLVLLHSSAFESGLGLDVHIRTKIRRDMSYISSAALRIGSDILEVESQGVYYLNGVAGAALPDEFAGFAFLHTQPTDKQHVFEVHLGGREYIKLKTYKDFVSVLIEQGQNKHFSDSVGLMGDFRYGIKMSRSGKSAIADANAFGQEWQVLDTEPMLFQTARLPQHPQKCTLPATEATGMLRRRLSESSAELLAAEKACARWGEGKDDCVYDVLTTGDLEMAVAGAY